MTLLGVHRYRNRYSMSYRLLAPAPLKPTNDGLLFAEEGTSALTLQPRTGLNNTVGRRGGNAGSQRSLRRGPVTRFPCQRSRVWLWWCLAPNWGDLHCMPGRHCALLRTLFRRKLKHWIHPSFPCLTPPATVVRVSIEADQFFPLFRHCASATSPAAFTSLAVSYSSPHSVVDAHLGPCQTRRHLIRTAALNHLKYHGLCISLSSTPGTGQTFTRSPHRPAHNQ
jgi:hypothetical protein